MLHVHHAERADRLVGVLADVLAHAPDDALAHEVVAVHSRGIERWLAQELSLRLGAAGGRSDGICANVEFPFPSRLIDTALSTAAEVDPDLDPWSPGRLVWPLLDVLEASRDDPALAPVRPHLPDRPEAATRRFGVARRIADLFDRYAVHRPTMVRAWAGGDDVDARGDRLAPATAWQPHLWRLARDRIPEQSPVERHATAIERLEAGEVDLELPQRLTLFGLTALPVSYADVLRALARHRDVYLLLLHPSPALWARVADQLAGGTVDGVPLRADDPAAELPRNPLLGAWGRDARELQLVVATADPDRTAEAGARPGRDVPAAPDPASTAEPGPPGDVPSPDPASTPAPTVEAGPPGDVPGSPGPAPPPGGEPDQLSLLDAAAAEPAAPRLLDLLQRDIREDRAPPGAPAPAQAADRRPVLDPDDRSVQVHACHGRTRQVEVVRDAILHLLADDPSLEPRDVVVLCPDIEEFAPLIEAVFGATAVTDAGADGDAHQGPLRPVAAAVEPGDPPDRAADASAVPDLRVRLADRSIRQTNPVLRVVAELLDLADGRVTAPEVLDLATREPVRRRFHLDEADLATLEGWVTDLTIRWGLDGDHRAAHGLPPLADHTWQAGLDRLLLGLAMADEDLRTVGGAVPYDAVEGSDADLAGRLAELVARLRGAIAALTLPQPIAGWADAIATAADRLTATGEADGWQRAQVARLLDDVVDRSRDTDGAPSQIPLTLTEVRGLLGDRLRGRPSRANHRTGDLTVCTLVPMRAVPHRVVCLLGMDDETFPRRATPDGDDLLERHPHVGDRDPRTEDRQLLLDAVLCAGDHLVVTYTGRDERTNEHKAPAVPIGELLGTIDATARTAHGANAHEQILLTHPLQPFDPAAFTPGRLLADRPWGFEPADLAGARARAGGQVDPGPFLPAPLAPLDDPVVALDDLTGFLAHPTRAFLRHRLDVSFPGEGDDPDEHIPVELDPLARYAVGDRMLTAVTTGQDRERWLAVERARGTLPPGALADPALDEITQTVELLRAAAAEHGPADASIEVDLALRDGRSLVGTVGGVARDTLLAVRYSKVSARHRLAAWAQLVAATAAHPERPLAAVLIGRSPRNGATVRVCTLGPLGDTPDARRRAAHAHLAVLVDLYDRGLTEPSPLYCKTSAAWAAATVAPVPERGRPPNPHLDASREWTTSWGYDKEDRDPAHALVLGGAVPFEQLLADEPHDDESGAGWDEAQTSRFGRYALRLWTPLLACEEVEDR